MINPGILYRVTGRYMDGQKIVGYHLVGEDESQSQESKDRVIWLIGRGIITNMRVQVGTDGEVIIRGKGVNLNNLPVYDLGKEKFRNDEKSQEAANSSVGAVKHSANAAAQMGQYKIIKRIMSKNKCLGYEVQDYTGTITRKKRSQVLNLATQRLISNAIVQKYQKDASATPELVLRGIGCDLAKLPVLIVDNNGKIIDPMANNKLSVRAIYMKHGGILHDTINNKKIAFKAGDFVIYNAGGHIDILDAQKVKELYTKSTEQGNNICDEYLALSSKYYIEVFGSKPVQLNENIVKKWVVLKRI